jgi:hypothetical protein
LNSGLLHFPEDPFDHATANPIFGLNSIFLNISLPIENPRLVKPRAEAIENLITKP